MREIKFRAWDGEQMISPNYIGRDGSAYWKENSIPTHSDKVMQFTGLHDKNGKEIYESDYLDVHWLVIWLDGGYVLQDMSKYDIILLNTSTANLKEVTGNVFESDKKISENT